VVKRQVENCETQHQSTPMGIDRAESCDNLGAPMSLSTNWNFRKGLALGVFALALLIVAYGISFKEERLERIARGQLNESRQIELLTDYTNFLTQETMTAGYESQLALPLQTREQRAALKIALSDKEDVLGNFVDYSFSDLHDARKEERQRKCLAQAIYFEARSEARMGQLAVADVVINRVDSRHYPDTICEVVFQGSERVTGCQFSFTCDGSMDNVRLDQSNRKWIASVNLAGSVLAGMRVPVSRNATHYHADYVDPVWAENLLPTATIGTHKFYRFRNSKISYAAPAGL